MRKLSQVVAVEKDLNKRNTNLTSDLEKKLQSAELLNGFTKKFSPLDADGETFPDETKSVSFRADELLKSIARADIEMYDLEATKNLSNTLAFADVIIDGEPILTKVPSTTLLFLEKRVAEVRNMLEKAQTLDQAESWIRDAAGSGLFRSNTSTTHKTKKVQRPIVLYAATPEHPAQTSMITEDVIIGHWNTTKVSGALPHTEKQALLERTNKLLDALKTAREQANMVEVQEQKVGQAIFGYLGLI